MKIILIAIVIILLLSLSGCLNRPDYSCKANSDCVHTCGAKCANQEWAKTYKDPCVNVRAYECSCVNNLCYSDGNPPKA